MFNIFQHFCRGDFLYNFPEQLDSISDVFSMQRVVSPSRRVGCVALTPQASQFYYDDETLPQLDPHTPTIYTTFPVPVQLSLPSNNRRELDEDEPYDAPPADFHLIPQVELDPLPPHHKEPEAQADNSAIQDSQKN